MVFVIANQSALYQRNVAMLLYKNYDIGSRSQKIGVYATLIFKHSDWISFEAFWLDNQNDFSQSETL